jgi:hypothetical protein
MLISGSKSKTIFSGIVSAIGSIASSSVVTSLASSAISLVIFSPPIISSSKSSIC